MTLINLNFPLLVMPNIVYVHAYVEDNQIRRDLDRFYSQIRNGKIGGLLRVRPVLAKHALDDLSRGQNTEFQEAVTRYPFEGLGIWTEWSDGSYVDAFYASQLHQQFSTYARGTLDKAWYRIVQLRDDKVSVREIK